MRDRNMILEVNFKEVFSHFYILGEGGGGCWFTRIGSGLLVYQVGGCWFTWILIAIA